MAIGQTSSVSAASLNNDSSQPLVNLLVVAYQAAPVREKPPSGLFRKMGKIVSETTPDTQYVICDSKTLPFSNKTWVELSNVGETKPLGWVYWGEEEIPDQSPNFNLVLQGNSSSGPSDNGNSTGNGGLGYNDTESGGDDSSVSSGPAGSGSNGGLGYNSTESGGDSGGSSEQLSLVRAVIIMAIFLVIL